MNNVVRLLSLIIVLGFVSCQPATAQEIDTTAQAYPVMVLSSDGLGEWRLTYIHVQEPHVWLCLHKLNEHKLSCFKRGEEVKPGIFKARIWDLILRPKGDPA